MSKKKKVNSKRPTLKIVSSSKKLSKTEQTLEMLKTINPCDLENREHEAIYDENHNQRVGTIWPWPELPQEHYLNDKTIGIRAKKLLCLELQNNLFFSNERCNLLKNLQMQFELSIPLWTLISKGYISALTFYRHESSRLETFLYSSDKRLLKTDWDKAKKNYLRREIEPLNQYKCSLDKITHKFLNNDITLKIWNEKVDLIAKKIINSENTGLLKYFDHYLKGIKKEHSQLMEV